MIPFEEAATRYADEFASPEALADLARSRLAERARRAGTACSVCGRHFAPTRVREGATCSNACRQKKFRSEG